MAQKWSTRKSQSLILPFAKKIDHEIRHLGRAFEHWGDTDLNEAIFKSSNNRGDAREDVEASN